MLRILLSVIIIFIVLSVSFAQNEIDLYFFPGQGSDQRIFDELVLPDHFNPHYVSYPVPDKGTSLQQFAYSFIPQIDTSRVYIFIGHSLGGMISTELTDTLSPLATIIISSAKSREELPGRYQFQSSFPLNKVVPKRMIKMGALILQPLVEPDRNKHKETFKSMLKAKDPGYLKRTADMIINWDRKEYTPNIIHIHGDNDHTIPHRNVNYTYLIKNGSHMMVLTQAEEINVILNKIFLRLINDT